MATFLEDLGNRYQGLFKCVRFRDLLKSNLFVLRTRCSPYGRGIPDIAAQAIDFPISLYGNEEVVSGTSGATPVSLPLPFYLGRPSLSSRLTANLQIVAAIISLLNDYVLSKGQPALGLLNPWLYTHGFEALFDISSGSNPGCNTDGFPAIDWWDPVRSTRLVTCSLSTWMTPGLRRSRVSERLTSATCRRFLMYICQTQQINFLMR